MADYLRRLAFWTACRNGAQVEWAGQALLNVGKTRAHAILNELHPSPLNWFRKRVLAGMRDGSIRRGRETKQSPGADCFFILFAGQQYGVEEIKSQFGASAKVNLDLVRRILSEVEREVADYMVYGNLNLSEVV
jgi:hypothetical protein